MQGIQFSYPNWFILICVVSALCYAVFLYFRESKFREAHPYLHWILGLLRFLSVLGICLLLLAPYLKRLINETKEPHVIWLEDVSESMFSENVEDRSSYLSAKANILTELEDKYEVHRLEFGDEIREEKGDSNQYKVTNISRSLEYLEENFGDQNLGAVILSTDGIFNEGMNPLYQSLSFKAPIYIVAQGDTSQQKDLSIQNIFNSSIAYLGDQFNVQVDISALNCSGSQSNVSVHSFDNQGNRKKIKEERIRIDRSEFFGTTEFILDANAVGLRKFQVQLSPINGEQSLVNNTRNFYIEVLDARQKILIYANAPHPDIAAFKASLSDNKNYELESKHATGSPVDLSGYDLVLFHNLPSAKANLDRELVQMNRNKIPRMFILGAQTDLKRFNEVQDNIQVVQNSNQTDDIQANINEQFSRFTLDMDLLGPLERFSPLIAPFGEYKSRAGTKTFLYKKIKKIDTDAPLLSFNEIQGIKTCVLSAEGIWKWRLFNFLEFGNHNIVNYIIDKSIQYTTVKEDKRKFRVSASKRIYKENESVFLEAQLFNNNYEAVNEPDVFVSIYDSDNTEFQYTFSKKDNYYYLNPGFFPEGNFRFKANVNFNGQQLQDEGKFDVQAIELEQYDLTARHDMLFGLAEKYQGRVFYPSELSSLSEELSQSTSLKPVIYSSTKTESVLNLKYLLFVLIGLLTLEWFIRRYFGSY